jgi:hypothetical protein
MSALVSLYLHDLLENAVKTTEQLHDYLASTEDVSKRLMQTPRENEAVVREKYQTVNRYIQFGDEKARWIESQTLLAVDSRIPVNGAELIQRIKDSMEAANRPAPSRELIETDLSLAIAAMEQPYTEAESAWARFLAEAWKEMEAVPQNYDNDRMVGALVIAVYASIGFTAVKLLPAKCLRHELSRRLNSITKSGSHDEGCDSSEQIAPASAISENAPDYRFELFGEIWLVSFGEEMGLFYNDKGMQHIARLLASPGKPVQLLLLMSLNRRENGTEHSFESVDNIDDEEAQFGGSDQEALDGEAIRDYHQRLSKLSDEIEKARDAKNIEKVNQLVAEYDFIEGELRAAQGLGGRGRLLGPSSDTKKAMNAVSKALKRAYTKMENATPPLPKLVNHLRQSISPEGDSYIYRPSPPVIWTL